MTFLIVEDEDKIANHLFNVVKETIGKDFETGHIKNELDDAIRFLDYRNVDILFLDLNLNGENGFEILREFVSRDMHTIIVSAYGDKAIEAFEHGVTDFIKKPFNRERISKALKRIKKLERHTEHFIKSIPVRNNKGFRLISPKEIIYIKGSGAYSEIHLHDGTREYSDKSLEKLFILLPKVFERVHRSYIVKMSEIQTVIVSSGTKYQAQLLNGEVIPIGRTKYKFIKHKWL